MQLCICITCQPFLEWLRKIIELKKTFLHFLKIENFPLYGLDAVLPQIQDNEFGLDTVFESEAIILPNSLKPLSNDFFIINHLQFPALFRVIDIEYDNMRADNFYKIHYIIIII